MRTWFSFSLKQTLIWALTYSMSLSFCSLGKSDFDTTQTSSPGWIGLHVKLRCPYSTLVSALSIRNLIGCSKNRNFKWRHSFFKISHQNRPKTMWKTCEKPKNDATWDIVSCLVVINGIPCIFSKNICFRNLQLVFMPRPKLEVTMNQFNFLSK